MTSSCCECAHYPYDCDGSEGCKPGKAEESLSMDDFEAQMSGIYSTTVCEETLDEAPDAYKPAEAILGALSPTVDIAKRIKPTYNFKATE